jgi:hypothetical protein
LAVAGNGARRKWPVARQDFLQHVRYESIVHHVRSKHKKCAVHVSLWPNTVLNNTSLHIAKSTGFRVVLCLYAAPTPMLHSYCTLPLHFHYTSTTVHCTVHDSTLQCTTVHYSARDRTRRNEATSPPPSPASIASRTASRNAGSICHRGGGGGWSTSSSPASW